VNPTYNILYKDEKIKKKMIIKVHWGEETKEWPSSSGFSAKQPVQQLNIRDWTLSTSSK